MDILDNDVNKRIMSGHFPVGELHPTFIKQEFLVDFKSQANPGVAVLRQYPEFFYSLIQFFDQKVNEFDLIQQPDIYLNEITCLINAKCEEDCLNTNESLLEANSIIPVITPIDKALWYGAYLYYMGCKVDPEKTDDDTIINVSTWIYLLNLIQTIELRTNQTVIIDALTPNSPLIDFILTDSRNVQTNKFLRPLTRIESDGIKGLFEKRTTLNSRILEERKTAKDVAEKTEKEWNLFIQVVNDLSKKEFDVIRQICTAVSPKEKLNAIYDYNYIITGIEKCRYILDGKEIFLLPVFDAVNERIQNASSYTVVCLNEGSPFRMNPNLFSLVIKPVTYNYFFMMFHQFRLKPSKDTAAKFFSTALICIKKNLDGEKNEWVSIEEMIVDFYTVVSRFLNDNKLAIDRLSYNKIQSDNVTVQKITPETADISERYYKSLKEKADSFVKTGAYDELIENMANGNIPQLGKKEVLDQAKSAEEEIKRFEDEAIAQQVITSLNIIYLFCEAVRIVLNNKHAGVKIKNKDNIERYRKELLRIDDYLVHRVYSHLDESEINMLEYREKSGVISSTLTEQEMQEEAYRNQLFSDVLKESVERLLVGIESLSLEEILKTKAKIRLEIRSFPDCDEKEYFANWLDNISNRISSALIDICNKQKDNFDEIKERILSALGEKSVILPSSTIDSLTTAELLYGRYASAEYDNQKFDYSCISSLYYQAFENAYNGLIWRRYADYLNQLLIGEKEYTIILKNQFKKGCFEPGDPGYGFLPPKYSDKECDWKHYSQYDNIKRITSVNTTCMYSPFVKFLEKKRSEELSGFYEWFAHEIGFDCKETMTENIGFMQLLDQFRTEMSAAVENRNNASHGGSQITMTQCSKDRKTVLADLKWVRESNLGLIQQLIYILNFCSKYRQ